MLFPTRRIVRTTVYYTDMLELLYITLICYFHSQEPVQVRGGDGSPPPAAYELKDKFHRLGLTGKLLCIQFHEVSDNAYDKLNKDR